MTNVATASPNQTRTLAKDVFARMRADILACELRPGAPLKFESLRDGYGASFTTLREALTALVAEGLELPSPEASLFVFFLCSCDFV